MARREPGVLRAIGELLRAWWQVDRVRASPGHGALLRLSPPCLLRIDGRFVRVHARHVGRNGHGPYVVYRCEDRDAPADLWVYPVGDTHRPLVRLDTREGQFTVSSSDIEVYG